LAERTHATVTEICCVAPTEVAAERLGSHRRGASDADASVAARLAATMDPWPRALVVDTAAGPVAVADFDP
jgi:uncharacterized protein